MQEGAQLVVVAAVIQASRHDRPWRKRVWRTEPLFFVRRLATPEPRYRASWPLTVRCLSGVAGLLVTARLDSATPNAGLSYELDSIAAVIIGGTSLNGGRGTIMGTVLGCLIIGVLNNGLVLLEVSPFWQQVIKGVVILVVVAVDKMGAREV